MLGQNHEEKTINKSELDHFNYTFACNTSLKPFTCKAFFEMPHYKTKQYLCSQTFSHSKKEK